MFLDDVLMWERHTDKDGRRGTLYWMYNKHRKFEIFVPIEDTLFNNDDAEEYLKNKIEEADNES